MGEKVVSEAAAEYLRKAGFGEEEIAFITAGGDDGIAERVAMMQSRLAEEAGLTKKDQADLELFINSYTEVKESKQKPHKLLKISELAMGGVGRFLGLEHEAGIFDADDLTPKEQFVMAMAIGIAVGIEVQERRHA